MRKLFFVLLCIFAITLTGCHTADPPQRDSGSITDVSSTEDAMDTKPEQSETETSSESAESTIPSESEIPSVPPAESKSEETTPPTQPPAPENTSSGTLPSHMEETPSEVTIPVKPESKPEPEPEIQTPDMPAPVPPEPNATAADSSKIADLVIKYVNDYRTALGASTATRLSGLTGYAEYRSRQLISNFAHDTDDERAAATALRYGEYIDPALYGMSGEPYYTACAGEAIAKAGYTGTADNVAKSLAKLIRNSPEHWCYVGASEYRYIGVGVTYESGMWYCDIALSMDNNG